MMDTDAHPSGIRAGCETRVEKMEQDSRDRVLTFEAVRWALDELNRIGPVHEQGGPRNETGGGGAALDGSSGAEAKGGDVQEAMPPAAELAEVKSEVVEKQEGEGVVGKRKLEEGALGRDDGHGKRARVEEEGGPWKKAVVEADRGDAGKKMEERMQAALASEDRRLLVKLVGQCLALSMDQAPAESVTAVRREDAVAMADGDYMWLHRWLLRAVLADAAEGGGLSAPLDWLIAFVVGARPSLVKPILEDLASDLVKCKADGSATLGSYLRRVGVLEYAALRDPDRIFGSLRPLFPPAEFSAVEDNGEKMQENGSIKLWEGWLGLMVLCPRLFGAFSCTCLATLPVQIVKSWTTHPGTASLPKVWTLLEDSCIEEPKTATEWVCAATMRRLKELAPVAIDFVVLLGEVDEVLGNKGANDMLTSLYKALSKHVLPKVLGSSLELISGLTEVNELEENGVILFMKSLKKHAHLLWSKAVEYYSLSNCTCCEVPRRDDSQQDGNGRSFVETSEGGGDTQAKQGYGPKVQKGCLYRDPFMQLCQLTVLSCNEHVVADLLASVSAVEPPSDGYLGAQKCKRLLMVMRMMRMLFGQGRGILVHELWAQQLVARAGIASDEQALHITFAMRQILDPAFWQKHDTLLGSSPQLAAAIRSKSAEDSVVHQGLSWKLVLKGLHSSVDFQWLHILPLLHRDGAWELQLAVLEILQLLNPGGTTRPQVVADRLKGAAGILFSWLESYDGCDGVTKASDSRITNPHLKLRWRWQRTCALEHLKSIIIELASSSFPSFTLMISSLLDFSFEHCIRLPTGSLPPPASGLLSKTDPSDASFQRVGHGNRSSFCVAPLSTGKLDRYGKLILANHLASELNSTLSSQKEDSQLSQENCRIQSGAGPGLHLHQREKSGRSSQFQHLPTSTPENGRKDPQMRSKVLDAELANVLHRTLERAVCKSIELLDAWPCHPVNTLATQLADRLETPHEVTMIMEQYEEILPKHISSFRHIFLTDCFSQNPLLMEMMELIIKHGGSRAVHRCDEFVRVLLADSISCWHNSYRTRWPQTLPRTKAEDNEKDDVWNRLQVSRLIQLVASANWLPAPLAASGEIVPVLDAADIADLLLLVWRCMHHAMAFGPKTWGGVSSSVLASRPSTESLGLANSGTTGTAVIDEEGGKDGTYTDWEPHFFAILRRNIAKIGAHIAQVYPLRKAL